MVDNYHYPPSLDHSVAHPPPFLHHLPFDPATSFLHVDSLCGEILSHLFALLMMMIQSSTTLSKSITTTCTSDIATRTITSTSITASTTIACGYGEHQCGTTSTASVTITSEYGEHLSINIASEYEGNNNDHMNPQVMTLMINSTPLYWSTKRQQDGLLMDLLMGLGQQVNAYVPFIQIIKPTSYTTMTMMLHHVWKDLLHHLWHYNDDNNSNKSQCVSSPSVCRLYQESFKGFLSFIVARLLDKFFIHALVMKTIMSQVRDQQSMPTKSSVDTSTRIDVIEPIVMHHDLTVWQGVHSVSNNKSNLLLDMNYHQVRPVLRLVRCFKIANKAQRTEHLAKFLVMIRLGMNGRARGRSKPNNSPRQAHIAMDQVVVPALYYVGDTTDKYCLFTGRGHSIHHKEELLSSLHHEMNHEAKENVCQHLRMITQANINTSNVTVIMYRGLFTGRPPGLSLLHVVYHRSFQPSILLTLDLHDCPFLTTEYIYPKWHHPSSSMSSKADTTKKSYSILLICRHCHHRCQGIFKICHSRRPISQCIRTLYFDCSSCIVAQATTRRLNEQAEHRRRQQIDDEQPRIHVIPDPDLEARIKVEEVGEEQEEEQELGIPISFILYDHPS
jgi:hypothetical protein